MKSGTIARWNAAGGYGFVEPDGGGPGVFCHITTARAGRIYAPAAGMRVSFEETVDRKTGKPRVASVSEIHAPSPKERRRETADTLWRNY